MPRTSPSAKKSAPPAQADARFRFRIRYGELIAIGPGKIAVLEAIQEHGSISAAARHLGMSYRRAWLLVDELNRSLQSPATQSGPGGASGGSSQLTAVGIEVVSLYRAIEARAEQACAEQIHALLELIKH